jgi:hypothetical protein
LVDFFGLRSGDKIFFIRVGLGACGFGFMPGEDCGGEGYLAELSPRSSCSAG